MQSCSEARRVRTSAFEFWEVTIQPITPQKGLQESDRSQVFIRERVLSEEMGIRKRRALRQAGHQGGDVVPAWGACSPGAWLFLLKTQSLVTQCKSLPLPAARSLLVRVDSPNYCSSMFPGWAHRPYPARVWEPPEAKQAVAWGAGIKTLPCIPNTSRGPRTQGLSIDPSAVEEQGLWWPEAPLTPAPPHK